MTDTPETDDRAEAAHNMCLYYDCQGPDDNIPYPVVVPADFARRLERERNEARKEAAMWKANHDNQVELKSIISKRGDLRDRAPRVEKLIAERDQLKAINAELLWTLEEVLIRWNQGRATYPNASFDSAWELIARVKEAQS